MTPARVLLRYLPALLCAAGAAYGFASGAAPAQPGAAGSSPGGDAHNGRRLFVAGCASCHGDDARGIPAKGPSLHGAGAAAADFYLSTGRMPLENPRDQPRRGQPVYTRRQIDDLVAYVASLGPGPPIPAVHPLRGSVSEGLRAFTENCAGCHQVVARGGIVTSARTPDLLDASPKTIGEAVRVGPYVMPSFSDRQIDSRMLNSIAGYVKYARHPEDRGGWGIGHIGPIPEGMVTWLLAIAALVLTIRVIGKRTTP